MASSASARARTGEGGRLTTHIDFGLASPRLLVDDRHECMGVADHDLVCYRLRGHPEQATWR